MMILFNCKSIFLGKEIITPEEGRWDVGTINNFEGNDAICKI